MNKVVILILALLVLTSCAQNPEVHPSAWIDYPHQGGTIPLGTSVTVISHGFARQGVAEVVLSVNGEAYRRDVPSEAGNDFVSVQQDWVPVEEGLYTLQVQVYDMNGQVGNPATVTVQVVKPGPTMELTVPSSETETPVPTVTPTLPQGAMIQFWAEPAEIQAGACTTIRWHVENAAGVIFGGLDQPFDGSYGDCLCADQRYTLTVVQTDGTEVKRTVDIAVNGVCETPTSPPSAGDTTPPPTPTPAVPADGLVLSCRSTQTLAWLPVDDPSGISGYYVKLEMEVTSGNWQSAGGYGPVTGKQVDVNVQCGGVYRWTVRAQDGAGNFSNWSAPSYFSINLN